MLEKASKVSEAFSNSGSPLSRRLFRDVDSMGPHGQLASLLFKAEKARIQAMNCRGMPLSPANHMAITPKTA